MNELIIWITWMGLLCLATIAGHKQVRERIELRKEIRKFQNQSHMFHTRLDTVISQLEDVTHSSVVDDSYDFSKGLELAEEDRHSALLPWGSSIYPSQVDPIRVWLAEEDEEKDPPWATPEFMRSTRRELVAAAYR